MVMVCLCFIPVTVSPQEDRGRSGAAVALNACWEAEPAEPIEGKVALDSERIYIPLVGGGIRAVNVKDGRSAWSADLGGELGSHILVTERALYIVSLTAGPAGSTTSVLRSLSKQTGVTNWLEPLSAAKRFYLGESGGGLAVVSDGGQIEFRSPDSGTTLWKRSVDGPVSAEPFFSYDKILIGTGQKLLFQLSGTDGRVISRQSVNFVPTAVSITPQGHIVTGDERGYVTLRNSAGDARWNFRNGARIAGVNYTKHGILAFSLDNFIYLLSSGSGNVVWKRRLPGRIFGQPAIGEEIAVATTVADGRAFVLEIESGKVINQIPIDNSDSGGLQPLLVGGNSFIFSLPGAVRLYSSAACSST